MTSSCIGSDNHIQSHKIGANNGTQACAACKYQRRKCAPDCILAPYFPFDRQSQFLNAHKLFGVSNITKIIRHLTPPEKDIAMRTIIYQSDVRAKDPVGGCYRIICYLQHQIEIHKAELDLIVQQLSICKAQADVASFPKQGSQQPIQITSLLECIDNNEDENEQQLHHSNNWGALDESLSRETAVAYHPLYSDKVVVLNPLNVHVPHTVSFSMSGGITPHHHKPTGDHFNIFKLDIPEAASTKSHHPIVLKAGKVTFEEQREPYEPTEAQQHELRKANTLFSITS